MQPFISQALLATRIAEMHRESQVAQRARDLKRTAAGTAGPDAGAARHTVGPAPSSADRQRARERVAHAGHTGVSARQEEQP
jgi:hypothetical protein